MFQCSVAIQQMREMKLSMKVLVVSLRTLQQHGQRFQRWSQSCWGGWCSGWWLRQRDFVVSVIEETCPVELSLWSLIDTSKVSWAMEAILFPFPDWHRLLNLCISISVLFQLELNPWNKHFVDNYIIFTLWHLLNIQHIETVKYWWHWLYPWSYPCILMWMFLQRYCRYQFWSILEVESYHNKWMKFGQDDYCDQEILLQLFHQYFRGMNTIFRYEWAWYEQDKDCLEACMKQIFSTSKSRHNVFNLLHKTTTNHWCLILLPIYIGWKESKHEWQAKTSILIIIWKARILFQIIAKEISNGFSPFKCFPFLDILEYKDLDIFILSIVID